jgi:hypothetical protein
MQQCTKLAQEFHHIDRNAEPTLKNCEHTPDFLPERN